MSNFQKCIVAQALLSSGNSIFVHLDPRMPDVECPVWLKHQPHISLEFGYNMPIPIRNLQVTEGGISGTLSFSRTPIWCVIPWTAVFTIVDGKGKGRVWEDHIPKDVRKPPRQVFAPRLVSSDGVRRGPPRRGHLRLVKPT